MFLRICSDATWLKRGRSPTSGGTRSPPATRTPRTSTSPAGNGSSSRGPTPLGRSTSSRTGSSRSASAKGTRSRSSRARPLEWSLFDFALGLVGAVGAPIYSSSSAARRAVRPRALRGGRRARRGRRAAREGRGLRRPRDLVRRARRRSAPADASGRQQHPGDLDARADSIDEDDLFTFIYTSGTTGPPKACMIRHRNYYAMVQKSDEMEDKLLRPGDVMLLYLPLAHNYGRLLHLSAAYLGFTIAFLPDPMRAAAELPRVRPTIFPSVPRVYEKIHAAVLAGFEERTGVQRRIVDWALAVGRRVSRLRQAKQPVPRAARRAASARRPARLFEGEGEARRPAARRERRRRAALPRHRRVLPLDRHPGARRLRPLRGHDRGDGEPPERVQVRNRRQAAARRRAPARRRRRDPHSLEHRLRRLLPRRRGDTRDDRRRGVRAHRRRRPYRRGRVPRDHRPQEGHHRHGRRQERRAAEPRERAEGAQGDLAGARRRRPQAVHRCAGHPRRGGDERHVGRTLRAAPCRKRSTR